jgi:hypothetical protein
LWWGVKLHILIHVIDQKQMEESVVVLWPFGYGCGLEHY